MSVTRHHAEWLSLLDISGPFLSLPVLLEAFPQGLDAHESEHFKILRSAYEEWLESLEKLSYDKAIHRAWIEFILKETLEYPEKIVKDDQNLQRYSVKVPEQNLPLQPDIAIIDSDSQKARVLIRIYPPTQKSLTKRPEGSRWAASCSTRMMELLHGNQCCLGFNPRPPRGRRCNSMCYKPCQISSMQAQNRGSRKKGVFEGEVKGMLVIVNI